MAKDCNTQCNPCSGEPKFVRVSGLGYHDFYFEYCDTAIQNDRDKGFTVEILDEQEYTKCVNEAIEAYRKSKITTPQNIQENS